MNSSEARLSNMMFGYTLVLPRVAISVACLLLLSSIANASDKCGSLDRIIVALRLAKGIYPGVKDRELTVALGSGTGGPVSHPTDARRLAVKLDKPDWHPPSKPSSQAEAQSGTQATSGDVELPLYLSFDFIDYQAKQPMCRPVFLNDRISTAHRAASEQINAHPEWNDSEVLAAAKQAGLRFGPHEKKALVQSLPLKELAAVYGPLQVRHAEFEITQEHEQDAHYSFARLQWTITVEEVGQTRILRIQVDPFSGRIFTLAEEKHSP